MAQKIAEQHRITCPYCLVGYSIILVERTADSVSFDQKHPVKCRSCRSYFKLKPKLTIQGVQLGPEVLRNTTIGEVTNGL